MKGNIQGAVKSLNNRELFKYINDVVNEISNNDIEEIINEIKKIQISIERHIFLQELDKVYLEISY